MSIKESRKKDNKKTNDNNAKVLIVHAHLTWIFNLDDYDLR